MTDYKIVFRTFLDKNQASEFANVLKNNDIDCEIIDNSPPYDITFSGGSTLDNEIQLIINSNDAEKATTLLEKEAENSLKDVDKDHYLFEFSNEELYDILLKSDKWSVYDYKLAKKILIDRAEPIDNQLLKTLKTQRINDLAKPAKKQNWWIAIGYLFALLGGLFGFVIGWFLVNSKKTLPNGTKVFLFQEQDQIHGRNILIISLVIIASDIIYLILRNI